MRYLQVDVFTDGGAGGNPLAVFPHAARLEARQMQSMAAELGLSETAFVTSVHENSYDVRIFTPLEELPFAGHPTLGTAWVLRHLGLLGEGDVEQRSGAGTTVVTERRGSLWFERAGTASSDLEETSSSIVEDIALALGLDPGDVGLDARTIGRSGQLRPAVSSAGIEQLMVPVRDIAALDSVIVDEQRLAALTPLGAYCFTGMGAGRLQARGLFGPIGVPEDPATGSAAAGLGLYLAARVGAIQCDVQQGVQMGRPSLLHIDAVPDRVRVGGRCSWGFEGELDPSS